MKTENRVAWIANPTTMADWRLQSKFSGVTIVVPYLIIACEDEYSYCDVTALNCPPRIPQPQPTFTFTFHAIYPRTNAIVMPCPDTSLALVNEIRHVAA